MKKSTKMLLSSIGVGVLYAVCYMVADHNKSDNPLVDAFVYMLAIPLAVVIYHVAQYTPPEKQDETPKDPQ